MVLEPIWTSATDGRLDGWKEIASYLRRDVRTVQRWEQANGLPVHRRQQGNRPIPYAFKSEVDAWWQQSTVVGLPTPLPDAPSSAATLTGGLALAVVISVAWLAFSHAAGLPVAGGTPASQSRVTTGSREARTFYTRAEEVMRLDNKQELAREMLRRAVDLDPGFASGRILLAWTIANLGGPTTNVIAEAARALDLSKNVTEEERFFIRGSYFHMLGKPDEASAAYEALLKLQPDHFWARRNLEVLRRQLDFSRTQDQNMDQAVAEHLLTFADTAPLNRPAVFQAVWITRVLMRDAVRAEPYFEQARSILLKERDCCWWGRPWIGLYPAFEEWMAGHADRASQSLDAFVEQTPCPSAKCSGRFIGMWYLALGRLHDAERAFVQEDETERAADLMELAVAREDHAWIRSHIADYFRQPGEVGATAMLFLRAEDRPIARQVAELEAHRPFFGPMSYFREGALGVEAALDSRPHEAEDWFEKAWRHSQYALEGVSFAVLERLAELRLGARDVDGAIALLERAAPERDRAYSFRMPAAGTLYFWMRTQDLLAQLYRRQDRIAKAAEIEKQLLRLLAAADSDHPMVRSLRSRRLSTHRADASSVFRSASSTGRRSGPAPN